MSTTLGVVLASSAVHVGVSVIDRVVPDADRELFGQGLANLAVPLVGGVPATVTLARTAVNVRCGATSRLASLIHALALALAAIAFAAGGLVAEIPRAALAGLMLGAAVRMIKFRSLASIVRTSLSDALIVAFTFTVTVAVNLIAAVAAGLVIATMVTVAALARSGRIEAMPLEENGPDRDDGGAARASAAGDIGLYRLHGPWFFAATHRLLHGLDQISGRRVVILSMSQMSALDLTAARVLGETITHLHLRGITVLPHPGRPARPVCAVLVPPGPLRPVELDMNRHLPDLVTPPVS